MEGCIGKHYVPGMDGDVGCGTKAPLAREIVKDRDFYTLNTAGDTFSFKGRNYVVAADSSGRFSAVEKDKNLFSSMLHFFTDRVSDCSFSSREARLSEKLINPKNRHFRVDVDKTLLYRGELPDGADASNYIKSAISNSKYDGEHGELPTVYISKNTLSFLKEQKAQGAMVSITSTGGWHGPSMRVVLAGLENNNGFDIDEFDNKETLNDRSTFRAGLFQKYRVLGDRDGNRENIMIDDQWHQRVGFKHSIDAREFGMG